MPLCMLPDIVFCIHITGLRFQEGADNSIPARFLDSVDWILLHNTIIRFMILKLSYFPATSSCREFKVALLFLK